MTLAKLTRAPQLRWHAVRSPISAADAAAELRTRFAALNQHHFGGELPGIPLRISARMRRRLGQLTISRRDGRPVEIAISRAHIEQHGWDEATHTLLHEMVHLWQWHTGARPDHGPAFRGKAREVGIHAAARRAVAADDVVRTGSAGSTATTQTSNPQE